MKRFFTPTGIPPLAASEWKAVDGIEYPTGVFDIDKYKGVFAGNIGPVSPIKDDESCPGWLSPKIAHTKEGDCTEGSLANVFERMAGAWTWFGYQNGQISLTDAQIFYDEIIYSLAKQLAYPSIRQFKTTGVAWAYGTLGEAGGFIFDHKSGEVSCCTDRLARPLALNAVPIAYIDMSRFLTFHPDSKAYSFKLWHLVETVKLWLRVLDITIDMTSYRGEKEAGWQWRHRRVEFAFANYSKVASVLSLNAEADYFLRSAMADLVFYHAWKASIDLASQAGAMPGVADKNEDGVNKLNDIFYLSTGNQDHVKKECRRLSDEFSKLDNLSDILDNIGCTSEILQKKFDLSVSKLWPLRNTISVPLLSNDIEDKGMPLDWFQAELHDWEKEPDDSHVGKVEDLPINPTTPTIDQTEGWASLAKKAWVAYEEEKMRSRENVGVVYLGMELQDLVNDQIVWSDKTFGTINERGPIGPLKHLEKEAKEAYEKPGDITELADCLLLLIDANRRSSYTPIQLIRAAKEKLEVCKTRVYPKPVGDVPSEHIKETE